MSSGRILIIDDDSDIRRALGDRLEADGHTVRVAADGEAGLQQIRSVNPEIVLLDLQMPGLGGMEVLAKLGADEEPMPTVVVMTAYGSIERAVEAMRGGAFDFIQKPFKGDRLGIVVAKALEHERLRRDVAYMREEARRAHPDMVSESAQMAGLVDVARRAAGSTSTILIEGESGTGKGALARAIHDWSRRRERPFVAVNCVGLPESLLETELFGHEKGAFTGADRQRRGRFEVAQGGTIFLDEIGATQATLQVKLLQVLQERTFERVGGEQTLEADVRVVAATNRDLRKLIEEDAFLPDLYYRLNVITLSVPPLRERRDDIAPLARSFLARCAAETQRPKQGMAEEAMQCLQQYDWPGNVRELENAIERAVVLGEEEEIVLDDLPERVVAAAQSAAAGVRAGYHKALEDAKRDLVRSALAQTSGHQGKAAELLGVHRTYLSRLVKSLGMDD